MRHYLRESHCGAGCSRLPSLLPSGPVRASTHCGDFQLPCWPARGSVETEVSLGEFSKAGLPLNSATHLVSWSPLRKPPWRAKQLTSLGAEGVASPGQSTAWRWLSEALSPQAVTCFCTVSTSPSAGCLSKSKLHFLPMLSGPQGRC